jgi:benzoyl-CoA reductase/2-hydroxyglutaryl-CoA dehydratase subunit BcrC/BadD/HgdB
MTLAEFMTLNKMDDEKFAKALSDINRKCDRATVTKWRLGKHVPSPPYLRAIIAVTKGKVSANAFFPTAEREAV